MKKLPWIIIIILLGVISYLAFGGKKDEVLEPQKGTEVAPTVTETPESSGPIFSTATEKTIKEDGQYLKVNIKYPEFKDTQISKDIRIFIQNSVSQFKIDNNIDSLSQTDKDFIFQNGAKYEINSEYKIYDGESVATVVFSISDYTGGAHGGLVIKSLNYNKAGQRISIGDLFKPQSNYLAKLSTLSKAKLKASLADSLGAWSDEGVAPISSNFETFYMTDGVLHIIFQPYQVAPWVAGAPEVSIDIKSELGDITNPEFLPK